MSLTPIERYERDVTLKQHISHDESQRHALLHLQQIYIDLIATSKASRQWFRLHKPPLIKGCYLYGKVGRGKTYLLDLFYNSLPFPEKKRIHFYRFMQEVHAQLNQCSRQKDPLKKIAHTFSKTFRVLCLDEFMLHDITDAMILAKLLKHLFQAGVTLVTTSNIQPDDLYLEGLQRKSFLPAIDLIKSDMAVINIDQGTDYRRMPRTTACNFYCPLEGQHDFMRAQFEFYAGVLPTAHSPISIHGRTLSVVALSKKVIWFEFDVICGQGRANNDYIYLSDQFEIILVSNIPQLQEGDNESVRRFIGLIDALYDAACPVVLSAEVSIDKLYCGQDLAFEFQRTISRLIEMQGSDYGRQNP